MSTTTTAPPPAERAAPAMLCRSGAAARLAGIPVATLRIWERRYSVVAPVQTPSGHRLYAPHDVQRLALLKQLVDGGHAIGTIAGLPFEALQSMPQALPLVRASALPVAAPGEPLQPMGLVAIGTGLAHRLGGLLPRAPLSGLFTLQAGFAEITDAETAAAAEPAPSTGPLLLLVQLPALQAEAADRIRVLARRLRAQRVVVLYAFGPQRTAAALRAEGVVLRRGPLSDAELADILAAPADGAGRPTMPSVISPAPPHRFDDAALAAFAATSSTVACECPRHIAELLMQLSAFEHYSAECASRTPADAALHAYLTDVAGTARALFETALERVAQAEGMALPLPTLEA